MVGYLHDELNSRSDSTSWHARLRGSLPTPMDRAAGGPAKRSSPWLGLAVVSAAALCDPPAHAADTDAAMANVDVAIAFAVDFSASIDPTTADLQREGHAAALTSPEIISAISENRIGCIGVAYFEWSSAGHARTVLPWTRICGLEDAKAAAAAIRRKGDTGYIRRGRGGTSVSEAIDVGSLLLDRFPGNAMRKVIDISSNGENNDGLPVQPSRQNAIAKGYTINAIAIPPHDKEPKQPLATYFARSVIGGSQAFVISPTGPRDYTAALRRKLVIEVSMNALSRHPVDDGTRKAINWDRDADAVFCHASASYRGDSDLMVDLDAPFRHARSLARPMASTGRVVAGDKAGPMPLLDVACAGPDRRGIRYASDGWQCHMCTY